MNEYSKYIVDRVIALAQENVELENQIKQLVKTLEQTKQEAETWRRTANWLQGGGYK